MGADSPKPLFALIAGLVALLSLHAVYGGHIGDFWEHTAVIKELAAHPFAPFHPLFLTHDPHPFYSPYALALGVLTRISSLSPETMLTLAGMANLCLFGFALLRFVAALGLPAVAAFYTLLFTLFFWGVKPWLYGGFLHIGAIVYTAPYPSTFAFALALLAPELLSRKRYALLVGLLATVVLCHPMTAVFAFVLVFAFCERPFVAVVVSLAALLATLAWPYYSPVELFLSGAGAAHGSNHWIYPGLKPFLCQLYPCMLALPLVALRLRDDPRDPLAWGFLVLASLYVFGGLSEAWAIGRVLPHAVFLLHAALAAWACRAPRAGVVALLVATSLTALQASPQVREYLSGPKGGAERYRVLSGYVGDYDVIMAHPAASYFIPAFAGRIVGTNWAVFLGKPDERRVAARRFFQSAAGNNERRTIIERYCVEYVVIDLRVLKATRSDVSWAWNLGEVVYNDDEIYLFRVDPGACAAGAHDTTALVRGRCPCA